MDLRNRYLLSRAASAFRSRYGVIKSIQKHELSEDLMGGTVRMVCLTGNLNALGSPYMGSDAGAIDNNFEASIFRAFYEFVERYSFAFVNPKLIAKDKTFSDIIRIGRTPDIETYSLFSEDQYRSDRFDMKAFVPDLVQDWIPARHAWDTDATWFVPLSMVTRQAPTQNRIYSPSSNGVAYGSTPQQALTNALLELVERDAFCLHWRNRIPGRRIRSETVPPRIDQALSQFGRFREQIEIYHLPSDLGLASVITVFKGRESHQPSLMISGACDFDPERSVVRSLFELGQVTPGFQRFAGFINKDRFQGDPNDQVRTFLDHIHYYVHPSKKRKTDFLWQGDVISYSEFLVQCQVGPKNLTELLAKFRQLNLDVLHFDHTVREFADLGGRVIRAIVPGLIQIDSEHRYRILGGSRIVTLPVSLGLRREALPPSSLNSDPHPFP